MNVCLLWLEWPYDAFRLTAASLRSFRKIAGKDTKVVAVRSERSFLRALPEATHAVVWNFDKAWFARAPKLRVLATPGAGRELLPKDDEMPKGVVRVNGAFHGLIMCETALAYILAEARGLFAADRYQREGNLWPRSEMSPYCSMLTGTHAVILGYGKIGRLCGDRLEAFGVRVTGITRKNFDRLDESLKSADWLLMALPSDTGTDDVLNARRLALLPRRCVIVNIGRGNSIDEKALAARLRAGKLKAAYLDVFKKEPLEASSPLAGDVPGLHRFPHCSAFAPEYLPLFWKELKDGGWLR